MDALTTGNLTGSQRDELMQQVKQQIAVANAQELLTVLLYNSSLRLALADWTLHVFAHIYRKWQKSASKSA